MGALQVSLARMVLVLGIRQAISRLKCIVILLRHEIAWIDDY